MSFAALRARAAGWTSAAPDVLEVALGASEATPIPERISLLVEGGDIADPVDAGEYVIRPMPRPSAPLPADREDRAIESDLIARYQAGEARAGEALLRMHAGIIYSVARRYMRGDVDPEDVMQEAKLGFLRGVKGFDESRGFRLVTYASFQIRHYAQRFVADHGKTIRVPVYTQSIKASAKARADARAAGALSLSTPIDDDRTLEDVLVGDADIDAEVADADAAAHYAAVVERLCRDLPDQERAIVAGRFLSDDPATLRDIGAAHGLSHQRIQQIEARAVGEFRAALAAAGARSLDDLERVDAATVKSPVEARRRKCREEIRR